MSYDLLNYLDNILGEHERYANNEYYWTCPFCHHHNKKFAINLSKQKWHCWVCDARGNSLYSLLKKINASKEQFVELSKILDEPFIDKTINTISTTVSLPREYRPLYENSNRLDYKHAWKYLRSRNITFEDVLKYQMGYCSEGRYANRIIIPSYDNNNNLNYFVSRLYYDNSELRKYDNPSVSKNVIIFENQINWKYPVVLCEGVFDAIAIKRNAIPLLGKTPSQTLIEKIMIENVTDIYLSLDNDALSSSVNIAEQFMNDGKKVHIVELKDKDPSIIGFEQMTKLIKNSSVLEYSKLLRLKLGVV